MEWLDSPEDHINELLKANTESKKPKVEWDTFADYHNDVMSFIDMTQAQVQSLCSLLAGQDRGDETGAAGSGTARMTERSDSLLKFGATEVMHFGEITANTPNLKKGVSEMQVKRFG